MLIPIDNSNLECYFNLSQHYEADFSSLTGKRPNSRGLYDVTPIHPTHPGYLWVLSDSTPAGFLVVDTGKERLDIAEFYVIPTERKKGLGRKMAFAAFDKYPGKWQVRQISGAEKAYAFWVSVISQYTSGDFTNATEPDEEWGRVRIQKFITRNGKLGVKDRE